MDKLHGNLAALISNAAAASLADWAAALYEPQVRAAVPARVPVLVELQRRDCRDPRHRREGRSGRSCDSLLLLGLCYRARDHAANPRRNRSIFRRGRALDNAPQFFVKRN